MGCPKPRNTHNLKLKRAIKRAGILQYWLAEQVLGITRDKLCRIVTGREVAPKALQRDIARALRVKPMDIF